MKKAESICGADCTACSYAENCPGCSESDGKPFGGKCIAAECIRCHGMEDYRAMKSEICDEFNALKIPGLPEITALNELVGSYVNMEYPLGNGESVKLLDDRQIYLGNQLHAELHTDSERCFGVLADETMLIVCSYGEMGADPELICYKKRTK